MPRCTCASECVYVCVCVCVCVDSYCNSCSSINELQVRVSIGLQASSNVFLDFNITLFSSYAYLECYCSLFRRVRSKTCPWSVPTSAFN